MISLCDEPETETTNKKLFFVYQRGVSAEKLYSKKNMYRLYTDAQNDTIVAVLQISKRQSPAAAPF